MATVTPTCVLLCVAMVIPAVAEDVTDDHGIVRYVVSQPNTPIPTPLPPTVPTPPDVVLQPSVRVQPGLTVGQPSGSSRFGFGLLVTRQSPRISFRLSSMPNMFGDWYMRDEEMMIEDPPVNIISDVPTAGGIRRLKVSENNHPLPTDRVFLNYQRFNNALRFDTDPTGATRFGDVDVDRYTLGFERRIFNGRTSVELRLPLSSSFEVQDSTFAMTGGSVGNLTILMKQLLLLTDSSALAVGLGINTPTGDNVIASVNGDVFSIRNDSVYLMPFVGFQSAPTDRFFYQGFMQWDFATNGNRVEILSPGPVTSAGTFTGQNLMHFDFSSGYWLYRNLDATVTGLAFLGELHYTTTLQNTDVVVANLPSGATATLRNGANRVDPLNLTIGLHLEVLLNTALRVGAAFPLKGADDRFFDSEIILQLNRRY